ARLATVRSLESAGTFSGNRRRRTASNGGGEFHGGAPNMQCTTFLLLPAYVLSLAMVAAPRPPARAGSGPLSRVPAEQRRGSAKAPSVDALGDALPQGAIARFGSVRLNHAGSVYQLLFSTDEKLLVSAGERGIVIWDVESGKEIRFIPVGGGT